MLLLKSLQSWIYCSRNLGSFYNLVFRFANAYYIKPSFQNICQWLLSFSESFTKVLLASTLHLPNQTLLIFFIPLHYNWQFCHRKYILHIPNNIVKHITVHITYHSWRRGTQTRSARVTQPWWVPAGKERFPKMLPWWYLGLHHPLPHQGLPTWLYRAIWKPKPKSISC